MVDVLPVWHHEPVDFFAAMQAVKPLYEQLTGPMYGGGGKTKFVMFDHAASATALQQTDGYWWFPRAPPPDTRSRRRTPRDRSR